TRCLQHRSSITVSSRWARRKPRWRPPGSRFARERSWSKHMAAMSWLEEVRWNDDGLVAAIAQDASTHKVLTLAWMNREALSRTADTREAHYWSRSRNKLWRKG